MAYLTLYNQKINEYSQWINALESHLNTVEENILQKDKTDFVVEKIVSVAFSYFSVTAGTSIVALFGIATGGIGFVLLIGFGWLVSNVFNRKVFGTEKQIKDLNNESECLLDEKQVMLNLFKPIKTKLKLNKYKKEVAFTQYKELLTKLERFKKVLQDYNAKQLAYKYRNRHGKAIKQNILLIHHFDNVYCSKKKLPTRRGVR
jgi:hypothetical protein